MAYKNPDEKKANDARYYLENRSRIRGYQNAKYCRDKKFSTSVKALVSARR